MPPRKKKPSFDAPVTPAAHTPAGWVYRSSAARKSPEEAAAGPAEAGRHEEPVTRSADETRAYQIVRTHSLYAAGAGLIPVPAVDMAVIAVIELKMVRELAEVYSVPFSNDLARPIVAALIGGYASTSLGYGAGRSLLKAVPIVGPVLGAFAVPGFGAGLTWAIGRVFILHFASGGTLPTLDVDRTRRAVMRA